MHWIWAIALFVAVVIILFPAAYVWYTNSEGIFKALKELRARRAARKKQAEVEDEDQGGRERA